MGKKIQGAMIDIDGTLLDTEVHQYHAWVEALKTIGFDFTRDEYKNHAGNEHHDISIKLVKEHGLDISPEELTRLKLEKLDEILENPKTSYELMPGALEALEYFSQVPTALVTNGHRGETELKLERSGLYTFVTDSPVITRDDVENGKPEPDLFEAGAKALNLPLESLIGIEDSEAGVNSIHAAGAIPIAILNPGFTHQTSYENAERNYSSLEEAIEDMPRHYDLQLAA